MKKTIQILALALLVSVLAALPVFAQTTDYTVGEGEGGLINDPKVKDAFRKAVDTFETWMYEGVPSGYVTREEDYYLQKYSDAEGRKAAVYVGPDYGTIVLRGPIYDGLENLGGLKKTGRPVSDAYEVNGTWYQNFEKGYVTAAGDSGTPVFVEGVRVNEQGGTVPMTATDGSGSSTGSVPDSGSDSVTDTPSSDTSGPVPSPSQLLSDVTDGMEEAGSRWGIGIFVILLVAGVAILLVYWFLKRK